MAGSYGAVAARSEVQEVQLAIAAKPDAIDLGFRRAVLGYAPGERHSPATTDLPVTMRLAEPPEPFDLPRSA